MPHEAKSWVVIAMADNHHGSGAELATAVETFSNEGSTDALPLPRRRDSHRCEAHDSHLLVTGEDHGREHDVSKDLVASGLNVVQRGESAEAFPPCSGLCRPVRVRISAARTAWPAVTEHSSVGQPQLRRSAIYRGCPSPRVPPCSTVSYLNDGHTAAQQQPGCRAIDTVNDRHPAVALLRSPFCTLRGTNFVTSPIWSS